MLPSFLLDYTRPRDLRWQASQRFILPLILVKYVLYVAFVAVSIAEIVLFRKWINYGDEDSSGWYSVDFYWFRVGIVMFPELVLIIAQIWTIRASKFHPVFALVSNLFGLLLWVSAATTNGITTYSDELSFDEQDAWERLCYAETGFQVAIAILYFPMLVGSCMAVHRWRKMKREAKKEGYKMVKVNSQENV